MVRMAQPPSLLRMVRRLGSAFPRRRTCTRQAWRTVTQQCHDRTQVSDRFRKGILKQDFAQGRNQREKHDRKGHDRHFRHFIRQQQEKQQRHIVRKDGDRKDHSGQEQRHFDNQEQHDDRDKVGCGFDCQETVRQHIDSEQKTGSHHRKEHCISPCQLQETVVGVNRITRHHGFRKQPELRQKQFVFRKVLKLQQEFFVRLQQEFFFRSQQRFILR